MSNERDALQLSRRDFLRGGAAVTAVGVLASGEASLADDIHSGLPTFIFRARRGRDLLDLEFRLINFTAQGRELVALGGGQSLIVVGFPSQNLGEAAFTDPKPLCEEKIIPHHVKAASGGEKDTEPWASTRPPVEAYLSGPSWIVFRVPDLTRLPLELEACQPASHEPCACPEDAPTAASKAHGALAHDSTNEKCRCPRCCQLPASVIDRWLQLMGDWKVRLPHAAFHPGTDSKPVPVAIPTEIETSIEIPFRLMIAPSTEDVKVVTSSERLPYDSLDWRQKSETFELWHAAVRSREKIVPAKPSADVQSMIAQTPELAAPTRINLQARAVYSPDYTEPRGPNFNLYYPDSRELSLRAATRHLLVDQMRRGDGIVDIENLILTALGGNANLSYTTTKNADDIIKAQLDEAKTDIPDGIDPNEPWAHKYEGQKDQSLNLAVWRHRIVIGRDVFYVQAFYVFLLPFVYPAMYVEVTQRALAARRRNRAITDRSHGPPGAFLLTRRYILVQNPLRQYPDAESPLGRMMPVKKAVIEELRSPFILKPANVTRADVTGPLPGISGLCFFPKRLADGESVRWKMLFEDGAAKQSRTDSPTLLVASNVVVGQKVWSILNPEYRRWTVPAQQICYAPQRPEIIVRADNSAAITSFAMKDLDPANMRSSTSGRKIINDVAFCHTLVERERRDARLLGEAIRLWLAEVNSIGEKLARLKELATATVQQLRQAVSGNLRLLVDKLENLAAVEDRCHISDLTSLTDDTVRAIGKAAETIETSLTDKKAGIEELLRQLGRCEQVSTALETHAINFDCPRVQQLYDNLAAIESRINAIATTTIDQVVADAKSAFRDLDPSLLPSFERQFDTLVKAVADANQAKAVLLKHLDELKSLPRQAEAFGTQYFQATLKEAETAIPALKALSGQSVAKVINLVEDYALQGITQVQNGVFAVLEHEIDEGKAMADQIKSGLAAPAAIVQGVARDLGAVVADGREQFEAIARPLDAAGIDLKKAIPDAKLFGVIPLRALVGLVAKELMPNISLYQVPEYYEQIWEWVIPLNQKYELPPLALIVQPPKPNPVRLRILLKTRVDVGKPMELANGKPPRGRVTLDGYLGPWEEIKKAPAETPDEAFRIVLADLIAAKFTALRVNATYLQGEDVKPKVRPGFLGVQFLGPLQFLNDLEKFLKFGDLFTIVVTPIQIGVRLSLPVTPIAFGAFSLQNIQLGTALLLPLELRALRFEFNFCSWEKPFELTVMCFGGRGYFRAALQSDGLRELEGAIEFGGALSFSVAVASGGLYVMAGGYLRIDNSSTILAGYLRAGGFLDVLGLITMSVEFLLMLCYRRAGDENQMYGIARVTYHIEILFVIDVSGTIEMEKTIVGSKDKGQSNQTALLDGGVPRVDNLANGRASNRMSNVSLTTTAAATGTVSATKATDSHSYFTRPTCKNGRFDWDINAWDRDYLSHFDFRCN